MIRIRKIMESIGVLMDAVEEPHKLDVEGILSDLQDWVQDRESGLKLVESGFLTSVEDERGIFHRYAAAKDWIKSVETLVKDMKEKTTVLETQALEEFERRGESSAKLDTGHTVFMKSMLWAGKADGVDDAQACEALRGAGLDDYVQEKFNVQSLSSYFRELAKKDEPVPETLTEVIKISEVFSVGVRRS